MPISCPYSVCTFRVPDNRTSRTHPSHYLSTASSSDQSDDNSLSSAGYAVGCDHFDGFLRHTALFRSTKGTFLRVFFVFLLPYKVIIICSTIVYPNIDMIPNCFFLVLIFHSSVLTIFFSYFSTFFLFYFLSHHALDIQKTSLLISDNSSI